MKVRDIVAVLSALLLAGCAGAATTGPTASLSLHPELSTEAAILELVARDLMVHDADQARKAETSACFVRLADGLDPPQPFLDRLASACALVRPGSAAPSGNWGRSKKLSTGESVILFDVGPIAWRSASQAEVNARYYCGTLCAASYLYVVTQTPDGWTVAKTTLLWIS